MLAWGMGFHWHGMLCTQDACATLHFLQCPCRFQTQSKRMRRRWRT